MQMWRIHIQIKQQYTLVLKDKLNVPLTAWPVNWPRNTFSYDIVVIVKWQKAH